MSKINKNIVLSNKKFMDAFSKEQPKNQKTLILKHLDLERSLPGKFVEKFQVNNFNLPDNNNPLNESNMLHKK